MPLLFVYLLKLSVAFAVMYLFYQLILRKLTFYTWNRWYLLAYTLLSFFIPLINITPVLEKNELEGNHIINWLPVINQTVQTQNTGDNTYDAGLSFWQVLALILLIGMVLLLARLIIQFFSFNRMKRKAMLFEENDLTIYQVNENIIPFSFGNSIFINRQLHNEDELKEIIRHEFVHVKQKHSIDIIWAEMFCLLNWYNPFAWLLKRSVRQNLEFIADNKVIQNGINKKEYQYLLLKVIGNHHYSIANQFNFSSLKKRIVMMNKTKSAKRQLLRMLFLLPATAILLLAFRNKLNESNGASAKTERFDNNLPVSGIAIKQQETTSDTIPSDDPPKDFNEFLKRNPQIESLQWSGGPFSVTIKLKNSSKETYNLENKDEIARLEMKYGKLPASPPLLQGSVKEVVAAAKPLSEVGELAEAEGVTVAEVPVKVVNAELAEVTVVGTPTKKAVLTTGELKEATVVGKPLTKTIATNPDLQEVVVAGVPLKKAISTTGELNEVTVTGMPVKTITTNPDLTEVIVVGKPLKVPTTVNSNIVSEANVGTAITSSDQIIFGDVDISITIKNTAKPEDLESFINKLKDKGYELKFDNKDYDNGILKNLSGTIKYKGSSSSFSFTDFDQATIIVYRDGEKVNFKIFTGKRKVTS